MIKNFFTIAIRHFARQRLYTLANLIGLSIGLTCILLIWLYISHVNSFDTFRPGADRTYRVLRQITTPHKMNYHVDTHGALTPTLQQTIPEIETINRIRPGARWVEYNGYAQRRTFWFTDANYLTFWGFKLKQGNPQTALSQPNGVVISQETVDEFFQNENPIGKTLTCQDGDYIVTGILDDQPRNSHFRVEFVTATLPTRAQNAWQNWETRSGFRWVQTFARLRQDADPKRTEEKLRALTIPEQNPEITTNHRLQSLIRMHLYGRTDFPEGIDGPGSGIAGGDLKVVRTLGLIGILVLFVACINFINLATARATLRAKEVGIRKVVGANQQQLASQFLLESVLLTFLSLPLCLILTSITLPYWQQIVGKSGTLTTLIEPTMCITLIIATTLIGLISGIYPAFLLSGFSPIKALHSASFSSTGNAFLRKVLVVFQFAISIFLVFVALVAFAQLDFVLKKDLGFNKENILAVRIFDVDSKLKDKYKTVKQRFLNHPNVLAATASASLPGEGWTSRRDTYYDPSGNAFEIRQYAIDEGQLPFINAQFIAGRNFSANITSDQQSAYILNETAVKKLGITDPIGKPFKLQNNEGWIIGVVKDFHMRRLTEKLHPNAFVFKPSQFRVVNLRLGSGDISQTMHFLENTWKSFVPVRPLNVAFLDDRLEINYRRYRRFQRIFTIGFVVSIVIASIGLLGLAAHTCERRRKEIGIRKVVGASLFQIMTLLGTDFLKLVIMANIIAWPFAHHIMQNWLQDFAYRANLGIFPFLISGIGSILITIFVVSYQTYKAASTNPVETLQYE